MDNELDFKQKYFGTFHEDKILLCRCTWRGRKEDLFIDRDVDLMSPTNRKNNLCYVDLQNGVKGHETIYEKCPDCKRCLIVDGIERMTISEEKYEERLKRL